MPNSDFIYDDQKVDVDTVLDLRGKTRVQIDYDVLSDTEHFRSVYEKMVYVILCKYANWSSKQSYPSISRIAAECFCSENTVRKALKRLEELRLIEIHKRKKRNGGQTSNLYVLLEIPERFKREEVPPSPDEGPPFTW